VGRAATRPEHSVAVRDVGGAHRQPYRGQAQIPSGFLLHDNAKYGHIGQLEGLTRCYGQPTVSGGSSRAVGEQANQVNISQEVRVYPDVNTAKQVYSQLRADLRAASVSRTRRCWRRRPTGPGATRR